MTDDLLDGNINASWRLPPLRPVGGRQHGRVLNIRDPGLAKIRLLYIPTVLPLQPDYIQTLHV